MHKLVTDVNKLEVYAGLQKLTISAENLTVAVSARGIHTELSPLLSGATMSVITCA